MPKSRKSPSCWSMAPPNHSTASASSSSSTTDGPSGSSQSTVLIPPPQSHLLNGSNSSVDKALSLRTAGPSNSIRGTSFIVGTGLENSSMLGVEIKRFKYLYLSHLNRETTIEMVTSYITNTFGIAQEDIRCYSLIPKSRNFETLKFISFKVGIPEDAFESTLSAQLWPIRTVVRPFRVPTTNSLFTTNTLFLRDEHFSIPILHCRSLLPAYNYRSCHQHRNEQTHLPISTDLEVLHAPACNHCSIH